jgi:uncharacterized membrane protein required for colicin V production
MNLNQLPINLFDISLLIVLAIGLARGRRHGFSEEVLPVLQWVAVIAAGALAYQPLGNLISRSSPMSLLTCFIIGYIGVGLLILGLFLLLKRTIGGKLLGSDLFGRTEYYLGMAAGVVRFACMLLAVLALLNARYFSPTEVRAIEKYQNDVYGSDFFPGLHSAQTTVFEESFSGRWIRDHLPFLLIKPTEPDEKALHQQDYKLPE